MNSTYVAGPVPSGLPLDGDHLTVQRAWPHDNHDVAGEELLTVEGRDGHGRVRAARLTVHRTGTARWAVRASDITEPGHDRKLPDLAAVAAGGTLLVHRFGKRAVVRRADDVVKVVRRGRADDIADRAQRGRHLAQEAGLSAPVVLDQTSGSVTFSLLPGTSLHDLGSVADLASWSRWWSTWSNAWPRLALNLSSPTALELPRHTATDESEVLRRWVELVERFDALPDEYAGSLRSAAERTIAALTDNPAQDAVVAHRDLHDKQLLAHDDELGLLDFDTAALAEPALDLANLWVHAALRVDQELWPARYGTVVQSAVEAVAAALDVSDARFNTYAAATRLRLVCIYAFRPRYRQTALAWAKNLHLVD